jgi:hypothetical protein
MTNLLTAVSSIILSTNTETIYPTRSVLAPCPDGWAGCLVAHYRQVPVENPTNRTIVTRVFELEIIHIKELNTTLTNSSNLIVEKRESEILSSKWEHVSRKETWDFRQQAQFQTNRPIGVILFQPTNVIDRLVPGDGVTIKTNGQNLIIESK